MILQIVNWLMQFKTAVRKVDIRWHGMLQHDMKNKEVIHPTQKPVKLYEWLLLNYAKKGDKILVLFVNW
jgi:site-specific DNA-methyltransferase (adenine-specific)